MGKKTFTLKYLFEKPLSEHSVRGLSIAGKSSGDSFLNLISSLQAASADKKTSALLFVVHNFSAGWAQAEEIIKAVEQFKSGGKKAYIYLEQADNLSFYLASCFDRIFMPPAGTLELVGLRIEKYYLKNLLEFAGVKPELINIGKYKSAGESLLREGMSEPAREVLSSILEDMNSRFLEKISNGRGLERDTAVALVDNGPWSARQAREKNLIDKVCYEDELEELLKSEGSGILVKAEKRLKKGLFSRILNSKKPKIALICASGKITDGESRQNISGHPVSGARTLCKQFREAREKKKIKAVVLRIDSPGGSASASDLIWREITLTAQKKPVICSMGNTAASGGYYIAAAAGSIFASPSTITGSIGVIGGKFDLSRLLEKLLIKTESLQTNDQAGYASLTQPMSEKEKVKVKKMLRDFYENLFLKKVSIKLKRTVPEIIPLAEGRVWTGAQAIDRGLIDSSGGLTDAINMASSRAGIKKDKFNLAVISSRSRLKDLIPLGKGTDANRIMAILPSTIRIR
jgi:protease IV